MTRMWSNLLLLVVISGLGVMWVPASWSLSVSQVGILTLGIAFFASKWRDFDAFTPIFPAFPLLGMLLLGALQLSTGATVSPWHTREAMLYWLTNLCALLLGSALGADDATRRTLWKSFVALAIFVIVFCLIHQFTCSGLMYWTFHAPYDEGLWGPFLYKNQYAAFIELFLPVVLVRALTADRDRWPYVIVTATLLACAVASASRAGALLAVAEVLCVSLLAVVRYRMPVRKLLISTAALLSIGAAFIMVVGPETALARFQNDTAGGREEFNAASIAMWRERPLLGFGLGTWPTSYPHYAMSDDGIFVNQAHNDWAQAAVEAGVPGFLCLAALFVWTVRRGWKMPWAMGLAVVLIHAAVDYPIQRQALGVVYCLFAGLTARSHHAANPYT